MDRMNSRIAELIQTEIALRGISRAELARRTGMSTTRMHRRLSGEVPLNLHEVDEIARALDVSAEHLLVAS